MQHANMYNKTLTIGQRRRKGMLDMKSILSSHTSYINCPVRLGVWLISHSWKYCWLIWCERKILFVGWKSTAYKPNKPKRTGRMSPYNFSSLQSSPFIIELCVHGCSIMLRHQGSFLSASFKFVPLSSESYSCKRCSHSLWQNEEPNKLIHILDTSNQVQLCFSDHPVSCPWDCCSSGICHFWENALGKECMEILFEIHYEMRYRVLTAP